MKTPIRINAALAAKIDAAAAAELVGESHANALLRVCHEMLRQRREAFYVAVCGNALAACTSGTLWTVVNPSQSTGAAVTKNPRICSAS